MAGEGKEEGIKKKLSYIGYGNLQLPGLCNPEFRDATKKEREDYNLPEGARIQLNGLVLAREWDESSYGEIPIEKINDKESSFHINWKPVLDSEGEDQGEDIDWEGEYKCQKMKHEDEDGSKGFAVAVGEKTRYCFEMSAEELARYYWSSKKVKIKTEIAKKGTQAHSSSETEESSKMDANSDMNKTGQCENDSYTTTEEAESSGNRSFVINGNHYSPEGGTFISPPEKYKDDDEFVSNVLANYRKLSCGPPFITGEKDDTGEKKEFNYRHVFGLEGINEETMSSKAFYEKQSDLFNKARDCESNSLGDSLSLLVKAGLSTFMPIYCLEGEGQEEQAKKIYEEIGELFDSTMSYQNSASSSRTDRYGVTFSDSDSNSDSESSKAVSVRSGGLSYRGEDYNLIESPKVIPSNFVYFADIKVDEENKEYDLNQAARQPILGLSRDTFVFMVKEEGEKDRYFVENFIGKYYLDRAIYGYYSSGRVPLDASLSYSVSNDPYLRYCFYNPLTGAFIIIPCYFKIKINRNFDFSDNSSDSSSSGINTYTHESTIENTVEQSIDADISDKRYITNKYVLFKEAKEKEIKEYLFCRLIRNSFRPTSATITTEKSWSYESETLNESGSNNQEEKYSCEFEDSGNDLSVGKIFIKATGKYTLTQEYKMNKVRQTKCLKQVSERPPQYAEVQGVEKYNTSRNSESNYDETIDASVEIPSEELAVLTLEVLEEIGDEE